MVRRNVEEWRELFEAHAQSGLTERKFCEERGLCPKYFSLRKKQLGRRRKVLPDSPFVRVEKGPQEVHQAPRVLLRLGRCEWEFHDVPADWLAKVMVALT